jgi:hypothetical protein
VGIFASAVAITTKKKAGLNLSPACLLSKPSDVFCWSAATRLFSTAALCTGTACGWNCAASVEPSSAVVAAFPLVIACCTASKYLEPLMLILPPWLWDARIRLRTTAVLAEEPIQVRRAILRVAAKIVDAWTGEIAEDQLATRLAFIIAIAALVALFIFCHRIERVELRSLGRYDAPDPIRLARLL